MVMDVAERNICKKCLKKIHKKRPSDELCYLIKHKQELGDQKARFVARVAERMAEIADIDFGTIRPLIPTIIQTIQAAAIHKRSSPFTCFSGAN
jgi:reverse gyrase